MTKNKIYLIIAVAVIVLGGMAYCFLSNSFKYEILDEMKNESEAGNMTFLFVDVSKLDSMEILGASKELMQEKIISKYKNVEMPKNADPDGGTPDVLIVYFYNQKDTTAIPEAMQRVLTTKFPNNDIVKMKLNYISEGFMYTGVYHPSTKKMTIDSLSARTMLFVPQAGVAAKDIMKELPSGHPDMEGGQLPEGHPKMDGNGMQMGEPKMGGSDLPPGHPPVEGGMQIGKPKMGGSDLPPGHPPVDSKNTMKKM